jgi:hypothetical protein
MLAVVLFCLIQYCVSLTTVIIPSEVEGADLSNQSSIYNGTVTSTTSASFYIKYNISTYGFATIIILPSDLFISVETAVTGGVVSNIVSIWDSTSSILITPTEGDCENEDESTEGGVNCMFLIIVTAGTTPLDEISFSTYGYVGQVFPTSNGSVSSFSSIPKGYSMFYLGMFPYSSYSGNSTTYYHHDVTISTNDSLAVYVYEGFHTNYVYSSPTYSSVDKFFTNLYGNNYVFQVASISSSSSTESSFDITIFTRNETYYETYYYDQDSLSAGAIVGIILGSVLGAALILLSVWFVIKVTPKLQYFLNY